MPAELVRRGERRGGRREPHGPGRDSQAVSVSGGVEVLGSPEESGGRTLLLVYPPPGPMAHQVPRQPLDSLTAQSS